MIRFTFAFLCLAFVSCDRDVPTKPAGKATDFEDLFDLFGQQPSEDSTQADSTQADSTQADSTQADSTQADSTQVDDSTQADSTQVDDSTQADSAPAEPEDEEARPTALELGGSVEGDRAALEAIHRSLVTGSKPLRGWMTKIRLGKWDCVGTNSQGRVTSLVLPCREDQNYSIRKGHLPPEIGQLTHLKHLDVDVNASGEFRPEIGQLTQLEHLRIDFYIQDESHRPPKLLPPEWANLQKLRVLDVSSDGPIPAWIGSLSALEVLDIAKSDVSPLPLGLGQLTNLRKLRTAGVVGPLPPELGQLTNLDTLWINGLWSGSIPPQWGGMSNLRFLALWGVEEANLGDKEGFSSSIPASLGQMTNLEHLSISGKSAQAGGVLPASLGQMTKLKQFGITGAEGELPAEWSGWREIETIWIEGQVEGQLPEEWGFMQSLERLGLQNNLLEGPLPAIWSQMKNLKALHLDNNFIDSPLPAEWGFMESLEELTIVRSGLTGQLPPEWGNLSNLRILNLEYNELTGTIPETWGNMTSLERLALRYNELGGPLPSFLKDPSALTSIRSIRIHNDNTTWEGYHPVNMCFSPDLFPSHIQKAIDLYLCKPPSDRRGADYLLGG